MKVSIMFASVLFLTSAMSSYASSGAEGGGGLPFGIIPVDVHFDCNAKLVLYTIEGGQRHYASFGSSFALMAKKGERTAVVPGVSHVFSADEWKLDQATAENLDSAKVSDLLHGSHSVILNFRLADYSKADVVDVRTWLDISSPYELFTSRTVRLSDPAFDNAVDFKVRQPQFYSSTSLEVSCSKADK